MALPVIRGVSALLYPFTMTLSFRTIVGRFQNGAEQRSIGNPGALVEFQWQNANMTRSQRDTIKSAVTLTKGGSDHTLSISAPFLASLATYFNLNIDSDEFASNEAITTQYSAPLKLSQSVTQGLSPGTPGLAFPTRTARSACCRTRNARSFKP
jgi:hypothetical protein